MFHGDSLDVLKNVFLSSGVILKHWIFFFPNEYVTLLIKRLFEKNVLSILIPVHCYRATLWEGKEECDLTVGGREPDFCLCWDVVILPSSRKMDVLMQEVTDSSSVFPTLFRFANSLSLYQRIKYSH